MKLTKFMNLKPVAFISSLMLLMIVGVLPWLNSSSVVAAEIQQFNHITTEDGLAHTDATCTLEDSEGFVWFGTSGGLQCYDGYQLRTYDFYESRPDSEIRNLENRITSIQEIGDNLIIGSKYGMNIFSKTERRYISFDYEANDDFTFKNIAITEIVIDKQGYIWVRGNSQIFVGRYDTQSKTFRITQQFKQKLLNRLINTVNNMTISQSGVWVAFSNSYVVQIAIKDGAMKMLKAYDIATIDTTKEPIRSTCYALGRYYILYQDCIYSFNVNKENGALNTTTYDVLRFDRGLSSLNFRNAHMAVDHSGNIWCSNKDGVVEIKDPFGKFSYRLHSNSLKNSNTLSTNFVSRLYVDSANHVWITTWGGGVNLIDANPKQFSIISYNSDDAKSINGQFVKAMERDSQDYLWIATENYGVDRYDFKSHDVVETYSAAKYLNNDFGIKDIEITHDCRYLFIGALNGLSVIDRTLNRRTVLFADSEDAKLIKEAIQIYKLHIDKNGNLWVATWQNGVFVIRFNADECSLLAHINKSSSGVKLSSNIITDVVCRGNKAWLTTNTGLNVVCFDDDYNILSNQLYAASLDNEASMSNNFTSSIAFESDSVVWVGTLGGGINRLTILPTNDPKGINYQIGRYRSENFTTKDGLPSNDVESVMIDSEGSIWMGGNGITKLQYPTKRVTIFDVNDGLQSNSFKIGSANKDSFGTMYFGGIKGLNYFNPLHIRPEAERGRLVLSDFSIHNTINKSKNNPTKGLFINYADEITLDYTQNDFTLELSALNFHPTNKVLFRYKLDRHTDVWQYTPYKYNRVAYANLDYGKYQFFAQVSFDGGVTWDYENMRTLTINITPPWWWSLCSRIIYLLLVIFASLAILWQYNRHNEVKHQLAIKDLEERRNEESHQLRLQFFTNISHEFRTPLTIII